MSYRWVEHTAELELVIEAPTEEEVFAQALQALRELLAEGAPTRSGAALSRQVSLTGEDRALLLADWLDELVFLAETEGMIPLRAAALELRGESLRATVEGVEGEPRPLVKGVTHHALRFERDTEGFRAGVVLDV